MSTLMAHRSSNGDDWLVETDADSKRFVLHRANPSSGGHETRMPIEEFLERSGGGPEVVAVRRITGADD